MKVRFLTFPRFSTAVSNQSTRGQLIAIAELPPLAFEYTRRVRMSTKYDYKCLDNQPLLLLPYPMFRSRSAPTNFESSLQCLSFPLLDLLSVNSAISVLKSNVHPSSAVPSRANQSNPFRIRSSAKHTRNSIRIRSFKTQHLKSFRMRSYKKTGWGHPLSACANPAIAGTIRVLDPIILSSQEGARCDE
jgi:hypothetical protein